MEIATDPQTREYLDPIVSFQTAEKICTGTILRSNGSATPGITILTVISPVRRRQWGFVANSGDVACAVARRHQEGWKNQHFGRP
jgi:hypothetical protein